MALMQAITPENLRAEMYRHKLTRRAVCEPIGMHPNALSMYVNGVRPLPGWAAHNIGWAMNTTTGLMLFDIDMPVGVLEPPRGRPTAIKLYAPKKKRRRYTRLADAPPTVYQLTGRIESAGEENPTLKATGRERR